MNKFSSSITTAGIIGLILLNSFLATSILNATALPEFPAEWQLNITGLVEHPMNLTLNDLATMPQTIIAATIYCVDFPTFVVETGNWKGVKLATLLEQAGVLPSAVKVAFYADDGYTSDLDLLTATSQDIIVAYEKDAALLSEKLRLVVPGKWGYKWVSQLTQIVLVDFDFKGKWESQGYSDEASVQTSTNRQLPSNVPNIPNPSQTSEPIPSSSNPQPSNSSITQPPQETQNSKPEPELPTSNAFPITWLVSILAITIIAACLAVYIKKRRHHQLFSNETSATPTYS